MQTILLIEWQCSVSKKVQNNPGTPTFEYSELRAQLSAMRPAGPRIV
jgi:hypothetical protein